MIPYTNVGCYQVWRNLLTPGFCPEDGSCRLLKKKLKITTVFPKHLFSQNPYDFEKKKKKWQNLIG
jgi:hypothetical protein